MTRAGDGEASYDGLGEKEITREKPYKTLRFRTEKKITAARFPGNLRNPCENGRFLMPAEMHRLSGKKKTLRDVWGTLGKQAFPSLRPRPCKIRTVRASRCPGNLIKPCKNMHSRALRDVTYGLPRKNTFFLGKPINPWWKRWGTKSGSRLARKLNKELRHGCKVSAEK